MKKNTIRVITVIMIPFIIFLLNWKFQLFKDLVSPYTALVATIIALFSETIDKSKSGIKRLNFAGWISLSLAIGITVGQTTNIIVKAHEKNENIKKEFIKSQLAICDNLILFARPLYIMHSKSDEETDFKAYTDSAFIKRAHLINLNDTIKIDINDKFKSYSSIIRGSKIKTYADLFIQLVGQAKRDYKNRINTIALPDETVVLFDRLMSGQISSIVDGLPNVMNNGIIAEPYNYLSSFSIKEYAETIYEIEKLLQKLSECGCFMIKNKNI